MDSDNVVHLADRCESGNMWSPLQALREAEKYAARQEDPPDGVLVLFLRRTKATRKEPGLYETYFYQAGLSSLEAATLCRVMELKFMSLLGTIEQGMRELIETVLEERT